MLLARLGYLNAFYNPLSKSCIPHELDLSIHEERVVAKLVVAIISSQKWWSDEQLIFEMSLTEETNRYSISHFTDHDMPKDRVLRLSPDLDGCVYAITEMSIAALGLINMNQKEMDEISLSPNGVTMIEAFMLLTTFNSSWNS
jgi:hypothetical protein